jgi:hypothetical protein
MNLFLSNKKSVGETEKLFSLLQQDKRDALFLQLEGIPSLSDSSGNKSIVFGSPVVSNTEAENEESFPYGRILYFNKEGEKVENNPHYKIIYFDFELLRKHLHFIITSGQALSLYKGFMWYLKIFCKNINSYNSHEGIRISITPTFIRGFLTIVRNHACDIGNDPDIISAFNFFFKEATAPYNLGVFKDEADTLLNILWMNMYLSNTLNKTLSYECFIQTLLFTSGTKNLRLNATNARLLYQIRVMQWHGNQPFTAELNKRLQEQFKLFKESSHPSHDERVWYDKILAKAKCDKKNLVQNYICPQTGQEIDIAYFSKKIAIHIDGPSHFNRYTGSKTLATIFRNKCLEKAGWTSIDINLLLQDPEKEVILQQILKLIHASQESKTLHAYPLKTNTILVENYADKVDEENLYPRKNKESASSSFNGI